MGRTSMRALSAPPASRRTRKCRPPSARSAKGEPAVWPASIGTSTRTSPGRTSSSGRAASPAARRAAVGSRRAPRTVSSSFQCAGWVMAVRRSTSSPPSRGLSPSRCPRSGPWSGGRAPAARRGREAPRSPPARPRSRWDRGAGGSRATARAGGRRVRRRAASRRPPARGGSPPPRQPVRRPPPRRAPPAAAPVLVRRPPAAGSGARSARSARRSASLDDVLLDRFDRDALGAEPLDGGAELLLPAVELEGDDPDLLADARAAHVEDQVELPAHLVDERLLHELLGIGQVELPARERVGLRLRQAWRRHPLHDVVPPSFPQPTHMLAER